MTEFVRATHVWPGNLSDPMAHLRAGNALMDAGRQAEAADEYARALALAPHDPAARASLAAALLNLGRYPEADAVLDHAPPDRPWTHAMRAVSLEAKGHYDACIESYRRALALDANFHDAHFGIGLAYLTLGRFAEGWAGYAWRPVRREMAARAERPAWDGRPAPDATLLIQHEQGFGDTIQMCRYIPRAAGRAGRVVLRVPPPLVRLMASMPCEVVLDTAPPPPHDIYCGVMDLPGLFETSLETIPSGTPYLRAEQPDLYIGRLSGLPKPWIGLCWSGRPHYSKDRTRSIDPALLQPLLGVSGRLISLQVPRPDGGVPPPVRDWTHELRDFADTANLIAALDLVISVDTAVAHLAGALGKPVWLLNRFDTEWRWMLDRDTSPWYPAMRIFRQPSHGDWTSVLETVVEALARPEPKRAGFASRLGRLLGRGR